ncbi:MAG: hypothetical protein K2P94_13095 [Rhodospirillaceae bacterium]|nr:hypothetical protein [Rhodospirillaceae bacterium]
MMYGASSATMPSRTAGPQIRPLTAGDERAFELFFQRHWSTSVTLRANAKAAGLEDQGAPGQGTYYAAWEGATIVGAAAHYTNDVIVLEAPRALNQVVRGVFAASGRAVAAIQGPWPQVEAAVATLALKRDKMAGQAKMLSTLDLTKMMKPDVLKRGQVKVREAAAADIEALVPWYIAHHIENSGFTASSDAARDALQQQIDVRGLFVAETDRVVAMAGFEVWQSDVVKIGGVYTPPALKDKGSAAAAVVGALMAAQTHGVGRAIILCGKNDSAVQKAYRAIGFTSLSDYGVLRAPR